ncbi:MAG: hypothetical protein WCO28_03995 [Bacteroidota bacterium]
MFYQTTVRVLRVYNNQTPVWLRKSLASSLRWKNIKETAVKEKLNAGKFENSEIAGNSATAILNFFTNQIKNKQLNSWLYYSMGNINRPSVYIGRNELFQMNECYVVHFFKGKVIGAKISIYKNPNQNPYQILFQKTKLFFEKMNNKMGFICLSGKMIKVENSETELLLTVTSI